jgi:hypothetical protein
MVLGMPASIVQDANEARALRNLAASRGAVEFFEVNADSY